MQLAHLLGTGLCLQNWSSPIIFLPSLRGLLWAFVLSLLIMSKGFMAGLPGSTPWALYTLLSPVTQEILLTHESALISPLLTATQWPSMLSLIWCYCFISKQNCTDCIQKSVWILWKIRPESRKLTSLAWPPPTREMDQRLGNSCWDPCHCSSQDFFFLILHNVLIGCVLACLYVGKMLLCWAISIFYFYYLFIC